MSADLSLGEGGTPLEDAPGLARWAGLERLRLKREDLNPNGSHKDRGAIEQIRGCVARGQRVAVISSSGNAALSATVYGKRGGVMVVALVSPLTARGRVDELITAGTRVVVDDKPISHGMQLSKFLGWPSLRPSLSEDALRGFRTLGTELVAELADGVAVVGYSSSGTTTQALAEVFAESGRRLPLHPVQAGLVNGLSAAFGRYGDGTRSMVGDLGVKRSPREARVVELVRASGGQAWWASNPEIREAGDALESADLRVAGECWAALAGARLAAAGTGLRDAVLVLTGREVGGGEEAVGESAGMVAHSFNEVLEAVSELR